MKVKIRITCKRCNGTGTDPDATEEEARALSKEHNRYYRAMVRGHRTSYKEFLRCGNCSGTGYHEQWDDLEELVKTITGV